MPMEQQDIKDWAKGQVDGAQPDAEMAGESSTSDAMNVDKVPLPELAENLRALKDTIVESIQDIEDKGTIEEQLTALDDLATALDDKGKELAEAEGEEAAEGHDDEAESGKGKAPKPPKGDEGAAGTEA